MSFDVLSCLIAHLLLLVGLDSTGAMVHIRGEVQDSVLG